MCYLRSLHVLSRESARVTSGVCKYPYFMSERVYAYTLPPAYRHEYRAAVLSKKY